jgi:hypothetical protein
VEVGVRDRKLITSKLERQITTITVTKIIKKVRIF